MSGGKSQTVSPRVVIADDIVLSLSHIGCCRGDFMGGGENAARAGGSVLFAKWFSSISKEIMVMLRRAVLD
jgi:hypothetical protein